MRRQFELTYEGQTLLAVSNTNTVRDYARQRNLPGPVAVMEDLQPPFSLIDQKDEVPDVPFEYLDKVALFLLCSLREGARISKQTLDVTLDDVFVIMDENQDYFNKIMESVRDDNPVDPTKPRAQRRAQTRKKK